MKESPIFARTYDLLLWLIPQTLKFPREQRFVLAKRVQDTVLDFHENLLEAGLSKGTARAEWLVRSDIALAKLRVYLRLCRELRLFSMAQYEHVIRMVSEVGRLLNGWRRVDEAVTN